MPQTKIPGPPQHTPINADATPGRSHEQYIGIDTNPALLGGLASTQKSGPELAVGKRAPMLLLSKANVLFTSASLTARIAHIRLKFPRFFVCGKIAVFYFQ